jgi:hypothetical protein
MAIKIRQSTGNVFRDLGFPREEAENLKVRAGSDDSDQQAYPLSATHAGSSGSFVWGDPAKGERPGPRKDQTIQY